MFELERKKKPAADYLMSLLDISENKRLTQDKRKEVLESKFKLIA